MKIAAIPPGTLLAEHARPATKPGKCDVCQWPIYPGAYIARLAVMTRGLVHVSCCHQIILRPRS
jgi:hypothetical protein